MRSMSMICILVFACLAHAEETKLPGKRIAIGPMSYSDIYPAVWFCPEDGSISPLTERSENPPKPKFRIWIEPRDPEMNLLPGTDEKEQRAFIVIGNGEDAYVKATKKDAKGGGPSSLPRGTLTKKKPVFIYKEKKKAWVCIVLELNTKNRTMAFMWRELK